MSRQNTVTRVWCLIFSLLLLFSCAACAPQAPTSEGEQRLEILEKPVVYSAAFSERMTSEAAALYCRLLPLLGGPTLTAQEQETLRAQIASDFLPIALRAGVSEEECERILSYCKEYEAVLQAADSEKAYALAYCAFYQKTVAVVGSVRAGRLLYDGTRAYLAHRISVCEERYRNYGYEWYLEQAQDYRRKLTALSDGLDAATFGDASRVLVFLLSFVSGALPGEWQGLPLYDGEVLLVLQMQANEFENMSVTAAQWQLMIELYADCKPKSPDSALSAEIIALQEGGILAELGGAVPELLSLYRALMHSMSAQDIAALRGDLSVAEQDAVLCRAALAKRQELTSFLQKFEALCAQNDGSAERAAMQRVGMLADCDAYLAEVTPVTADELLRALAGCADAASVEESVAVRAAMHGYLRGNLPYLAFALSGEEGS